MKKQVLTLSLAVGILGSTTSFAAGEHVSPSAMITEENGSIIIADSYNHQILRYENGGFSVIAGALGADNADGSPSGSYRDGEVDEARFNSPWDIEKLGDIYVISDTENHRIRVLDIENGTVGLIAGDEAGYSNGTRREAEFNRPTGIAIDEDGSIYVADTGNHVIRKMDIDGKVTLFAGVPEEEGISNGSAKSAKFNSPTGLAYEDGILYVADTGNNRICAIEDGEVTTIAGSVDGLEGFGNGKDSYLSSPTEIIVDNGDLYFADSGNGAVRKIEDGRIENVVLTGEFEDGLSPVNPRGLTIIDDTLYIGDVFSYKIESVSIAKNTVNFSDVLENDWFADAVINISSDGIVNGMGDGTFAPNSAVNRAMFITTLSRIEPAFFPNTVIDGALSFSDVEENSYYEKATKWAAHHEIAEGTGENFLPNDTLTRAQCVTFLFRYAKYLELGAVEDVSLESFSDVSSVADWASEPMVWAVSNGIISGTDEGLLAPNDTLTRAQMAVILDRFIELL